MKKIDDSLKDVMPKPDLEFLNTPKLQEWLTSLAGKQFDHEIGEQLLKLSE
ncbi:MAG: hypothetical protein GY801_40345 [bacterium]|nr:hypothetical protein [bacterium]